MNTERREGRAVRFYLPETQSMIENTIDDQNASATWPDTACPSLLSCALWSLRPATIYRIGATKIAAYSQAILPLAWSYPTPRWTSSFPLNQVSAESTVLSIRNTYYATLTLKVCQITFMRLILDSYLKMYSWSAKKTVWGMARRVSKCIPPSCGAAYRPYSTARPRRYTSRLCQI